MPTYTYRNTQDETEEHHSITHSWAESEEYIKENPQYARVIGAPNFISGHNNRSKIPEHFKDTLREMKKKHPKGDFGQAL